MTEEKSLEELQKELESLKKANLEKEIAKEKEKLEAEKKVEEEESHKALEEEIRTKILSEMEVESKVTEAEPVEENTIGRATSFVAEFKQKHGYGGTAYEELTRKISSPGNYKGGRA